MQPGVRAHLHLRLVVQPQLAAAHGVAQRRFQGQPFLHGLVHFQAVEHDAAAAFRLGAVHGDVGMAHQRIHVPAIAGEHRHAHAGLGRHHHAAGVDGLRESRQQAVGQVGGLFGAAFGQGDDELVAGQARHHVAVAELSAQAPGQFAQQRVASGVSLRVVDDLEAVDVDEQHRGCRVVPRGRQQHLLGLVVEEHAVGQAGQRVVERQLVHVGARALALQCQGAQVQADVGHALVEIVRRPVFPVVQRERTEHAAVVRLDGTGPACADAEFQERRLVGLPARIAFDVRGQHRLPAPRGASAGTDHRARHLAFDHRGDLVRQAGGGERMQAPVVVQPDHRGHGLRHDLFHFAADLRQHLADRLFADDRAQYLAVQFFVQLAVGDVGVDAEDVAHLAFGVVDRIDHRRDPQRHAALRIGQQLGAVSLLRVQLSAHPFQRVRIGVRAHQEIAGPAADDFVGRIAQHPHETLVDVSDAGGVVADDHGVVAVVDDHQRVLHGRRNERLDDSCGWPHGYDFPRIGPDR